MSGLGHPGCSWGLYPSYEIQATGLEPRYQSPKVTRLPPGAPLLPPPPILNQPEEGCDYTKQNSIYPTSSE